ncbi:hypothetical protein LTR09_012774 [Extremus antarcticus]|uniref:Uncharacterized protein n=1 Tax=Extremus antarcticus TaxID=702011 RepID=A0AAJ0D9B4_9PEZI|nr:hypothetical protein LTR09_012774 [Extremus antarcticus]
MSLLHHRRGDAEDFERKLSIRLRNIGKDLLAMRLELQTFCAEFQSDLNSVKQALDMVEGRQTQPDDLFIPKTEHLLRSNLSMQDEPHISEDMKSGDGSRDNDLFAAQTPRPLMMMKHNKDFAERPYGNGGIDYPLMPLGGGYYDGRGLSHSHNMHFGPH